MDALKIAIGDGFLESFARIPKQKQKKVMEFVGKFRNDPRSNGINYESIHNSKDDKFRSVRIDQEYRGIVLKPEKGDVYILLWVDKHDDAYQWACRHRCDIHPFTGVLQLIEMEERAEAPENLVAETTSAPLFELPDDVLRRLGVPDIRLDWVKSLKSSKALEAGKSLLPIEAFEALLFLASGFALEEILKDYAALPDQPVDVEDFSTALERDSSKRSFFVVADEMELLEMLEAPLEKWRVYLHPSQRKLIERSWNGPVRVLGGAGTGKTVVAMHRAKWIAQHVLKNGEKLLFTTFTGNLAEDIKENLRKICNQELLDRMEVENLDAWVNRFLKRQNYPNRIVYRGGEGGEYEACWDLAINLLNPSLKLPESFYLEEWERVVLPGNCQTLKGYLLASRLGRGVSLTRKQRAEIWPVFEEMRLQLSQKGLTTIEEAAFTAAAALSKADGASRYRAAIVDEGQDFGPEMLSLLRQMVPSADNDLFIVGDGHQRIYRRKAVLSKCGIDVRGRSKKLKINYRTTEEIRDFATSVLEGIVIDNLDAEPDDTKDYRSLTHGGPPLVRNFESIKEEVDWILEQVDALIEDGLYARDICIAVRTTNLMKDISQLLKDRKTDYVQLSRNKADAQNQDRLRLATMHRVKGLEFKAIFLACANDGIIPLAKATSATSDPAEKELLEANERALFHVAATRAVKYLHVTSHGKASRYLRE